MVAITKDNGFKMSRMDMVSTKIQRINVNIKENGKMVKKKVQENRNFQMEQSMQATLEMI